MRVIRLFPMFSKFFRKIRHILIIKGPLFWVGYGTLAAATILMCGLAGVIIGYSIELPQVEELQDIRPNVISYVYAKDQQVIGEFAVEKRVLVTYDEIPERLKQAILSAEDDNFFQHVGIDFRRFFIEMIRNVWRHQFHYSRWKGASTLTMQLCKLRFTGPEKRVERKIKDWLFALETEKTYSKEQIFTLYVNQIYMGHGIYGMAAASDFYFKKSLEELSIGECALLAGILNVPGRYSPIRHPERALARRAYTLRRMREEGYITTDEMSFGLQETLLPKGDRLREVAPYFVEWVRQALERDYATETIWEGGLRVQTTLDYGFQVAARQAVERGLKMYDKKQWPWEGVARNILDEGKSLEDYSDPSWSQVFTEGQMVQGLVTEVGTTSATIHFGGFQAEIGQEAVEWTSTKTLKEALKPGDLALFQIGAIDPVSRTLEVELDRIPAAQAALLALDNKTGAILAMVGGFDFNSSKFNRATQALRQPGSIFKPFTYMVALEEDRSPYERVLDAPVSYIDSVERLYEPKNSDNKFKGLIPMSQALAESRNVPTVRLARALGIRKVIEAARRFGIDHQYAPELAVALGSGETTLLELASAFSVFPNNGVRAIPYFISRVEDYEGVTLDEHQMQFSQATSPDIASKMLYLLRQVVLRGTGRRARVLERPVGGKTGTTNEATDVWFVGFTPDITVGVWVGFDEKKSLGEKIYGANLALPIWIDFMGEALKHVPPVDFANIHRPTDQEITLAEREAAAREISAGLVKTEDIPPPPPPSELSLIGQDLEDAIDRTGNFLNWAFLGRLPEVLLTHEFASGPRRAAFERFLEQHPHVKEISFEESVFEQFVEDHPHLKGIGFDGPEKIVLILTTVPD